MSLPAERAVTAHDMATSVRGAITLLLDELNASDPDICRYQELADTAPIFTSVTVEGVGPVQEAGTWAIFDIPVINGPSFRVLFIPSEGR